MQLYVFSTPTSVSLVHVLSIGTCCVGTLARLGYATFDAQLRKPYFVTPLYTIHTYVCACIYYMLVTTCLCIWSSWYEYAWFKITQAMPGYAQTHRHLWCFQRINFQYSHACIGRHKKQTKIITHHIGYNTKITWCVHLTRRIQKQTKIFIQVIVQTMCKRHGTVCVSHNKQKTKAN